MQEVFNLARKIHILRDLFFLTDFSKKYFFWQVLARNAFFVPILQEVHFFLNQGTNKKDSKCYLETENVNRVQNKLTDSRRFAFEQNPRPPVFAFFHSQQSWFAAVHGLVLRHGIPVIKLWIQRNQKWEKTDGPWDKYWLEIYEIGHVLQLS